MTAGDRVMSPKILCFGFCDAHRSLIPACIQLRDSIAAAATLSNAPKQFHPRVPSASINETADWNQIVFDLAEWYDCTSSFRRAAGYSFFLFIVLENEYPYKAQD